MFNFLDNRPSTSSSTRGSRQGYVNPTFQSSVFSHVNDNLSAARVAPDVTAELGLPARKKVERIEGYSFVLPTSHEYNPKSSDINNPDAHKDVERHGANIAYKKTMQDFDKQREHKEKLNAHVRENMQKVEEKHQTRLDHKKPAPEVRQEYKAAETAYFEEVADEVNRTRNVKNNYAGNLKTQMDKKTDKRQAELEKERNDLRTGFTMKPRKEYDMQEYKDVLKNQMNEKSLKASQAKQVKQNEREERLQELRDQERMAEHYTQQLANRRPQSASLGGNTSISVNSGTLGKKSDWEAASAELLKKKDEQDQHLQSLKDQIDSKVTMKQQEINRKKEEERAIKGFDLANHRTKVTAQQVAEVLKTQMKQKQQVRDKEAEIKQGEVAARKEEIKGSERVAWQQYEEYRQKKAEMFDQYKQDHASYAPIKKNKGLMTVKIN